MAQEGIILQQALLFRIVQKRLRFFQHGIKLLHLFGRAERSDDRKCHTSKRENSSDRAEPGESSLRVHDLVKYQASVVSLSM